MSSTPSRKSVRTAVGAAAALALLAAGPAAAAGERGAGHDRGDDRAARTTTYALPGQDVFPEGVDTAGSYYYVTSTTDGTVFRGEVGSDDVAEVFLPGGRDGRTMAVGIEATRDLLLVAGGATGLLFVHDRETGELLGRHAVPAGGSTFVNDLAVSRDGDVYVTDSARDVVYRLAADDVTGSAVLDVLTGFAGLDPVGPFNANGVVVTKDGRYLVVVQSDSGLLYRVSTADGDVRQIDLGGVALTAGDGLELKGRTLYVVRNAFGVIAEVRLDGRLRDGRVVDELTDPTFMFPTTVALDSGRLLVVNSQFDARGGDPVEPFTVSSVKRP